MEEIEFLNSIKKVNSSRVHKVKNSWGVYDAFKWYRKHKPNGKQYILKEVQDFAIIRSINNLLRESFIDGNDIKFPEKMGSLELRANKPKIVLNGKKVKTNLPIDWNATLKLWYEDKQAYKDKFLVKTVESEIYKIYYSKNKANYNNKSFYQFIPNREFKLQLKHALKEENLKDKYIYDIHQY